MDGLKSNTSTEKFKTDEVVMYFYLKFELLEKSYYKLLAGVVIRRYWNTCLRIIQDKVNKDNIDLVLSEEMSLLNYIKVVAQPKMELKYTMK